MVQDHPTERALCRVERMPLMNDIISTMVHSYIFCLATSYLVKNILLCKHTYCKGFFVPIEVVEIALGFGNNRELFRVQDLGLPNQTCTTKREIFLVRLGEFSFRLQLLVHSLTDSAVGSVGANNDIALDGVVVGQMDSDPVVFLRDVENAMTKVNLVGRDLFEDKIVELGTSNNILPVPRTSKYQVMNTTRRRLEQDVHKVHAIHI